MIVFNINSIISSRSEYLQRHRKAPFPWQLKFFCNSQLNVFVYLFHPLYLLYPLTFTKSSGYYNLGVSSIDSLIHSSHASACTPFSVPPIPVWLNTASKFLAYFLLFFLLPFDACSSLMPIGTASDSSQLQPQLQPLIMNEKRI